MTQLVLSVDISPAVPPLFTRSISLTTWDVNNEKRLYETKYVSTIREIYTSLSYSIHARH